jgi:hypothetical protein
MAKPIMIILNFEPSFTCEVARLNEAYDQLFFYLVQRTQVYTIKIHVFT